MPVQKPKWTFSNKEALQQFPKAEIGSPKISSKPVEVGVSANLSFGGDGKASFAINPTGSLSIAVLNDAADVDEDQLVGQEGPAKGLGPQLQVDDSFAYLKLRAEAAVKASGEVSLGSLIGVDAGGEASVIFADYRAFPRSASMLETLKKSIDGGARFVTKVDDVLELGVNEALMLRRKGTLLLAVEVAWSDLFTGQLGALSKALGTMAPIQLSSKAGVTIGVRAKISDEFLFVISRPSKKEFRLAVRKWHSSGAAISADAGIDVGFAEPQQVEGLIAAVIDGAIGAPLAKARQILGAASLESLDGPQRKIAERVIARLGLDSTLVTLAEVRERLDTLESKAMSVIADLIRTRISLSFAYEYNRVSSTTSLVQVLLSEANLKALHADLAGSRTESLVAKVGEPGVTVETYLNEKEVTRTHSWGFTLGFGKWATLGGKDLKKVTTVRRTDIDGRVQDAYQGARSYQGTWIGETVKWGVDFKADMKEFAREPLVSDFGFGLHLYWLDDQKELSGMELEQWLDSALIWQVIGDADLIDVRARLAPALGDKATLSVQMVIPNSAIRFMLPHLASASADGFANALGAAMPWMNSPARASATRRAELYGPLWSSFIQSPGRPMSELRNVAAEHLSKHGHQDMRVRELMVGTDPLSFAGLTRLNGDTIDACNKFARGMHILNTSIQSGARNQKTIDKVYGEVNDLFAHSHHVRALGIHLAEVAARAGVAGSVTRTMTVQSSKTGDVAVVA
ncbi:MAG: hypothetical protein IAG10_18690 [Planctomycetaceae bacterium]|nr:hypothetical protein [Planctomycetaceae bacterium]